MANRNVAQKGRSNANDDDFVIEIRVYSPLALDWYKFLNDVDEKLYDAGHTYWTTVLYAVHATETGEGSVYVSDYAHKPYSCHLVDIYCNQPVEGTPKLAVRCVEDAVKEILGKDKSKVVVTKIFAPSQRKERQLECRVAQLEKEMEKLEKEIANLRPRSKL